MDNTQPTPEEIQDFINILIKLPPNKQLNIVKLSELIIADDPVIYDAIDKLKSGSLTRDQFFDLVDTQWTNCPCS